MLANFLSLLTYLFLENFDDCSRIPSHRNKKTHSKNPHFEMLYCNKSETDMIKWKSNYKKKTFEVSASDEFSKKAELLTKKVSQIYK